MVYTLVCLPDEHLLEKWVVCGNVAFCYRALFEFAPAPAYGGAVADEGPASDNMYYVSFRKYWKA